MDTDLFTRYADAIRSINLGAITHSSNIPLNLLLEQQCPLKSYYIPFDVVNSNAKVVLVGITPGLTQWKAAITEAQIQLRSGASHEMARIAAKKSGAFSGTIRPNLVGLLDTIGLHHLLKIPSCDALFGNQSKLVHTSSILRHPVFVDGKNYNGTPNMLKSPFLRQMILNHFAKEAAQLPNSIFIGLGPKVSEGLSWLVQEGVLKQDRVLAGLPHPSGANAERISYFIGNKKKEALSSQTNGAQLDAARLSLVSQVAAMI